MRSYKSTIGGACSVLGKTLMGAPVASIVAGNPPSQVLLHIWMVGFIIDAVGGFLANLFSADKSEVSRMMKENDRDADTRFVTKEEAELTKQDTKAMLRGKADAEEK